MATGDDVREIALALPEVTEDQWYRTPAYKVAGKGFLRLRTEAEGGLVVFVSDPGEKESLLSANPEAYYTTRTTTATTSSWPTWQQSTSTNSAS